MPKFAMEQFTPPAMVIRNDHPKLPMEPTVVVPPQVKLAQVAMPNFGDPKSAYPNLPDGSFQVIGGAELDLYGNDPPQCNPPQHIIDSCSSRSGWYWDYDSCSCQPA
ncbi:MAG: hypothetical protein LAO06_15625 [Acidobacteriia bacterium]|nr:hypothetical protein [Terriglobia bacterium]